MAITTQSIPKEAKVVEAAKTHEFVRDSE